MTNSMQELKTSLGREQPRINAAIARYIGELPPSSRPVAEHVLAAGGKRLRPFLTLTVGRALGAQDEDLYALGASIEMLHAATLLHDDILDNSELRRGKPAAHTRFGVSRAILAGDALLAKALLTVSGLGDTRLTGCIAEAVMRTAEGEILESAQLRDASVTHEGYLEMITGKTAWMLRASCELGALSAGAAPPLVSASAAFGLELGIAFQMVDDALDFAPSAETGKPRGGDLREGKITPPFSLYLEEQPAGAVERLRSAFERDSLEPAQLEALCEEIYNGGFAQKTREEADAHLRAAAKLLSLFPASGERIVLEQMLCYIQYRDH